MYYFAYASNLNQKQMQERCPDSKPLFIATLHHYRLVFLGWSRQWRGGYASIRPFRGGKVLGAIELVNKFSRRPFDDRDMRTLSLLAPIAATAIDLAALD